MKISIDRYWLFSKSITILPKIILFTYIANILNGIATNDPNGILSKNDFVEFWVGSSFAVAGNAASVYDIPQFYKALAKVAGQEFHTPWFYPPIFLLFVFPLSLFSYYTSFTLWIVSTMGGYLLVVRRIAPHPATIWLALAFPGALININYGQNGLLSCALLGGGLLLLNSFPVLSGILLGLLSYKPNFFVLIPVALMAGRHWRALVTTLTFAVVLALASGFFFGWETWAAYWSIRQLPLQALEQGIASLKIMPTIFVATRMAGGGLSTAYVMQGVALVASTGAVIWVWSQKTPMSIRVSVLILGSLLFTPYGSEYELARLAIPLAWIGWEGFQKGWLPREKLFIIIGWLTPLISRFLAEWNLIQITPLLLIFMMYLNLSSRRLFSVPTTPADGI